MPSNHYAEPSIDEALEQLTTKPLIDIGDYCVIYSRSRAAVYAAIKRGEIATVSTGTKIGILSAPLRAQLRLLEVIE